MIVLDAISEPGSGKANEDGYGSKGAFAWVIDGATGLGDEPLTDGPSDAAWLTAVLGAALAEYALQTDDPVALLERAAALAAARFEAERRRPPQERYEIPTAAVLVARFGADVSIAELGDCGAWIEAGGALVRFGGTQPARDLEKTSARRLMTSGATRSPETMDYLRAVRNRVNTAEGDPVFAPDADCARRARRHHISAASGLALLVTDGFEAGLDDYGLFTGETLMRAAEREGLARPVAAIRSVERDDQDLTRFPRFKPSDDATAILVRFGDTS